MKLQTTLLAASLSLFAVSTAAWADDEHHDDANGTKTEMQKTKKTEAKKPVKKHSQMEEKSGMPMAEKNDIQGDMHNMDMHNMDMHNMDMHNMDMHDHANMHDHAKGKQ